MMKKAKVEYIGKDLEAMDLAENYHNWILSIIKPYLGKHLVEVGAGTGAFSRLLLTTMPETLSLVEPSAMFETLKDKISGADVSTTIRYFHDVFVDVADQIKEVQSPDSIIYINVLEHVEDDSAELATIYRTLEQNGRLCIFVPAQPFLYSEFDKHLGHFRRYREGDLVQKCREAGFKKISLSRNFDLPGIFPWFVKYRLFKSLTMEQNGVRFYDKHIVPVTKWLESSIHPPIGKNLLVIAEKSETDRIYICKE